MRTRLLLELDLTRGLLEAPASTPLGVVRARHVPVLRTVVESLRRAATDDRVAGLVAHVGQRQPTLAQSSELRAAVHRFRRSGKPAVCWAESFGELTPGNVGYHLAAAFDEVWLQPSGDVGLTGVVAEAVFLRGTLDKLGVDPQIGQRHEYKTAADTLLRSSMTDAHREMAARLVESAMDTIVADVAADRSRSARDVRAAVDAAPLSAEEACEHGLVDRLGYRHQVLADLRSRLGDVSLRYVERYGKEPTDVAARAAALRPRRPGRTRPAVAVLQASGGIHLGRGGRAPANAASVGSDTLGAALRAAADDDTVKAVVLRVDSPGGSYVASDAIRQEVLAVRRTGKPVVASLASVAASGGYYIAMPADVVVASAGTLTGSIGVLAGKQVLKEALSRLGVERESVAAGAYAEMFSSHRRFSDDEWQRLEAWLDRVYADFTAKAAHDRGMAVADLRAVAKGRVWTGADAQQRGLVDTLGGLSEAVDVACERARVRRADVDVRPLPRPNLVQRLRPAENSEHPAAAPLGTFWGRSLALSLGASLGGSPDGSAGALADTPFAAVTAALGLPSCGVLTMPVQWRLR